MIVGAGIVLAGALHAFTPAGPHAWHWLHVVAAKLYYIPIVIAAAWLGPLATAGVTLIVSALSAAHIAGAWADLPMVQEEQLAEIATFWLVGSISATLFSHEREAREATRVAHEETLAALAGSLDLREHYTAGHSRRVRDYALVIASEMGLRDKAFLANLAQGALLHDVGKIGIPDRILLKTGPLGTEERSVMRRHPELGASLVGEIAWLLPARALILAHHERYDGAGYPQGLAGATIPLAARIFTVAADRNLRLWNLASGDLLDTQRFAGGSRLIAAVAPDIERAVLLQTERTLRLVELDGDKRSELLRGHTAAITFAGFSPDGLRLVTACNDGSARLWDATTGRMVTVMRRHAGPILGVVFAPDGKRIVTIGEDRTARLWSEQGVHIAGLTAHTGTILGAVFSSDNATLATHSDDHSAILWGAQSGKEIAVLAGHTDAVLGLSFSADSRRLVTASADTTARVWHSRGDLLVELIGHTDHVRMARFSSDGARVLTVSDDSTARLWNSGSGNVVATLEGHTAKVRIGRFSPDGARVLTVGDDNTARLWYASLSNAIPTLKGHSAPIRMARFSPDGSRIVTASDDKTARLWNASSTDYNLVSTLSGHIGPVSSIVFSGEGAGRMITLAEDDPTLRLWDSQTGALLHAPRHAGPVLAATFSRDGARMISAGADDTLRVWEVATGVELTDKVCQGMHSRVDFAALAPGGAFALIASRSNNRAVLVPAGCGYDIDLVGHSGPVTGAAFSPDGDLVATISTDNTVKLWSTRYGNDIDTLDTGSGAVHSVNFSRDGARLVIATARDAWVYNLDIDEGNKPVVFATLQGHSAAVLHANFSSNGARIVTASSDNTAKLWAIATPGYELIATLHGHSAAVSFADFSPDGSLVVTAGRDSRAKVYPTTLEAFFKKACEALRSHQEDFGEVAIVCGGGTSGAAGGIGGSP